MVASKLPRHPKWDVRQLHPMISHGPSRIVSPEDSPVAIIPTQCLCSTPNMAIDSEIAVLNSTMKATPQDRIFHLFPSLPKELRLDIWEEAVPRERLIRVYLSLLKGSEDKLPPRYLEKNHLGNPISGPRYKAVAEGHQINSKFLCVNKEAREVALAFYRVHMPFSLRAPGTNRAEESTMLYLNPEHDVLHIEADAPVKETLIDFFWDMKAYDPKGVGLSKIAIDLEGLCAHDLQYLRTSDLLLIRQRNILVETLSQLREVWFVYVESGRSRPALQNGQGTRHVPGPDSHTGRGRSCINNGLTTNPGIVPIAGNISTFERVGSDPRKAAETELSRLYMGRIDPRELVWRWKRLLRNWAIRHQPEQVKYRLLVGQRPVSRQKTWLVRSIDHTKEFISAKDAECGSGELPSAAECVGKGDERRGKTVAVGHWMFPVEALGEVGEGDSLLDVDFRPCRFLDMRNHWPELLLSSIG